MTDEFDYGRIIRMEDMDELRAGLHPDDAAHLLEKYRTHLMPKMLRALLRQQQDIPSENHAALISNQASTATVFMLERLLAGLAKNLALSHIMGERNPGGPPKNWG